MREISKRAAREALRVITSSYEYHGGFRLRTLAAAHLAVIFARVNFQDMIGALNAYWAERGAVIMQPYHTELGAGTSNPATFLRVLDPSQTDGEPRTSSL